MDPKKAKAILAALENEIAEQWLIFLDDNQIDVKRRIESELLNGTPEFQFHLILGSAGTGKTQVLMNLAESIEYRDVPADFVGSKGVLRMISAAGFSVPKSSRAGSVVLIDDPKSFASLREDFVRAIQIEARALVVAVDPFQWKERLALVELALLVHEINVDSILFSTHKFARELLSGFDDIEPRVHILTKAYRQKGRLGRKVIGNTISVHRNLQPFKTEAKDAEYRRVVGLFQRKLMHSLEHTNSGGRFSELHASLDPEKIWNILARFAKRKSKLWTWTEPILLVQSASNDGQSGWNSLSNWSYFEVELPGISESTDFNRNSSFREILKKYFTVVEIEYSDVDKVRGQEFQHVLVFLSHAEYYADVLNGVGAGSRTWEKATPLHTFMSRAVDSVTLVIT